MTSSRRSTYLTLSGTLIFNAPTVVIFGSYFSIYLSDISFSGSRIGIINALGQAVVILAQFVWGPMIDRAPTKNRMLRLFFLGSGLAMAGMLLGSSFGLLLAMTLVYCFFNAPVMSTIDTISLEALTESGGRLGLLRMISTVSTSLTTLGVGYLISKARWVTPPSKILLPLSVVFFLLCLGAVSILPSIKGHQNGKKYVPFYRLFKDRMLLLFLLFTCLLQIGTSMSRIFFNIHLKNTIGADTLGLVLMIGSLSVLPYLFFADKIESVLGTKKILAFCGLLTGVQLIVASTTTSPGIIMMVQILSSVVSTALLYTMVIYMNQHSPNELKATGQALLLVMMYGVPCTLGNALGGVMWDLLGITSLLRICGIYCAVVTCLFGAAVVVLKVCEKRKRLHARQQDAAGSMVQQGSKG